MNKDCVFIKGLSVDTVIGIYEWERKIRQTVLLDVEMTTDISPAAKSDKIEDTPDYFSVSQRLTTFIQQSDFQLIEALAEACAGIILNEFATDSVKLTVYKPGAVENANTVGVSIYREKQIQD